MAKRVPRDYGPDPVAILATCFVVAGGLAACSTIIFASSTDPWMPFIILGGSLFAFGVLYWLLTPKRSDLTSTLFWFRRPAAKQKIQLRFHRHKPGSEEATANGPPTAESIRELKVKHNVWVRSKLPGNPAAEESPGEA